MGDNRAVLTQEEYDKRRSDLDINPLDKLSRRNWAACCAAIACKMYTPELLALIVARGFGEYELQARKFYHGHGFKTEDYRLIFDTIVRTSKLNPPDRAKYLNQMIVAASQGRI